MQHHYETDFEAVRNSLAYAYENMPFFRKHMDNAQLAPGDIKTPADFRRVPPTEKKHYRKNFPVDVLARGYSLNDPRLYRFPSAGTTGERLLTVELGHIYMKRADDCISVYPSIHSVFNNQPLRQARYAAPNCSDVECANPHSTMADRLLEDGTLVLAVYHDLLTTPESILAQNAAELKKHQPQMYFIDSSHFAFLFRYMHKQGNGGAPPKAPVLASYTPCTRISKRQIRQGFGGDVPVAEVVSMSELGFVAMECPVGSLHLNTRSFYIEFLCNGRPAETGELAELYVTTLDNGCIPHIRYRTGDVYRFLCSDCLCGHKHPVVQMEGRLRHFLFREGKIALTSRELDKIVDDPPWMDLYKMKQADEDDFLFTFIANDTYEQNMEDYIREELLHRLGSDVNLVIEKTDYIPTERSGKFLSCVSTPGGKYYEGGFQL